MNSDISKIFYRSVSETEVNKPEVIDDIRNWKKTPFNKNTGYFSGWTVLKDIWNMDPEEHFWERKPAFLQTIGTALHLRHNAFSRLIHLFAAFLLFLGLELMDTIMGTVSKNHSYVSKKARGYIYSA